MEISEETDPKIPLILAHDKVFSIQVGYKLFKISGASLSSDGPSYFTNFFSSPENESKVLFIDRNPFVFDKLYMHLQGYHIKIESEYEFVYIWQDAFYYGLKRLQKLLNDECSIACIGNQTFKVPKCLVFSPGNYPNYFSMGLESLLTKGNLVESTLSMIRPPSQRPPSTANRSPKLFADLLEVFWGNDLIIRDDSHRELLIKECQYYHFLELEQRIIKHKISHNPFTKRAEITLNLHNVVRSGLVNKSTGPDDEQPIAYVRPYIAREPERDLLIQIDSAAESTAKLILNRSTGLPVVVFENKHATKIMQLFKDLETTFGDPNNRKKLVIPCCMDLCSATVNGQRMKSDWFTNFLAQPSEESPMPQSKRPRSASSGDFAEFQILKSIWKVSKTEDRSLLQVMLLDAVSEQSQLNQTMEFL